MNPQPTVVAIGEVLWDIFPSGSRFGGAPANFACSVAGLSEAAHVFMISAVGHDQLGRDALRALDEHQVNTSFVDRLEKQTGNVRVSLDAAGVASYEFASDCAWDHLRWSDPLDELANSADAVCFGTLGQRSHPSRTTIQRFVSSTRADALRIFDINLRPPFVGNDVILESLKLANVLKLNDEELPVVAELCGIDKKSPDVLFRLAEELDLRAIALTRGADGAMLLVDQQLHETPGVTTAIKDTVGAGDAFTAACALGWLNGTPADAINRHACEVAAFVCSQSGATPLIPDHLIASTSDFGPIDPK